MYVQAWHDQMQIYNRINATMQGDARIIRLPIHKYYVHTSCPHDITDYLVMFTHC